MTIAKGGTWDESTIVERDYDYEAKCRCVDAENAHGISICMAGCGDPT